MADHITNHKPNYRGMLEDDTYLFLNSAELDQMEQARSEHKRKTQKTFLAQQKSE